MLTIGIDLLCRLKVASSRSVKAELKGILSIAMITALDLYVRERTPEELCKKFRIPSINQIATEIACLFLSVYAYPPIYCNA